MKQSDLDRAVARATGESVSTIKRLGFLLADLPDRLDSNLCGAHVIDWDELHARGIEGGEESPRYEPATL